MEGQLLGNRYELIERIGGGGMAIVYKARCTLLNRYVAIKILRSEFTDDEEFVRRFRIEAQAAASLSHPNIVPIFDVGHDGNTHYIVMEYIDGITLKEHIEQVGALPWKQAVSIAIQVCSAIEQAHKKHIVHRDIKPHNILITKEGIAKVTDFGIARAVTSATITMVGSTIGSVHYFSPEQARGTFTDEKSDLYSLGITIYEMVTGRVPFDGESPVAVALKHIQEKPERPSDINPSIPKGLNDIIMKAVRKDQNLRYQNATEMLSDLRRALAEPDAQIAGAGNASVEELPTRKMRAVGSDIGFPEEDEGVGDGEGEEDEERMDPVKKKKRDRLSIWLGIVTGLVIAGIIFYLGMRVIVPAIMPDSSEEYIVPDYTNRDFYEVRAELDKIGINAVDSERVFSDTIPENVIISQDIATGNKLKPGNTIKFKVSNGPELVEVPDVAGKESRIGEQMIRDANLEPEIINEYSDTVGMGLIIRTEPAPPEKLKPGGAVTVYESLGPELARVKVPNVIGLTRAEAEKLILDSKLTIGKIIPEDVISDVAKIIKQYPAADMEVDEGTPVEITFDVQSAGQSTVQTTDRTGGSQSVQNKGQTQAESGTQTSDVQNQASGGAQKTYLVKIAPDPNKNYGDRIRVYVEATPSDTNRLQVVFDDYVAKGDFPISVPVTLSKTGTTHIIVKLDNDLVQEGDY